MPNEDISIPIFLIFLFCMFLFLLFIINWWEKMRKGRRLF